MRVHFPIALMKNLPTMLQHSHLHLYALHKKQGTNQYVYKLLQSHCYLNGKCCTYQN